MLPSREECRTPPGQTESMLPSLGYPGQVLASAPRCISTVRPPRCIAQTALFHNMVLDFVKDCFKWSKRYHLGDKVCIQASALLHEWPPAHQTRISSWFSFCTHVSSIPISTVHYLPWDGYKVFPTKFTALCWGHFTGKHQHKISF